MGAVLGKPAPKANTGATSPALPAAYFGEEGAAEGETRLPVGTTGGRRRRGNRKSRRNAKKTRKTRKSRK